MSQESNSVPSKEQQKAKIRNRYKGVDTSILEVIPSTKKTDFYDDVFRRVGVYVRVSTDSVQQTTSYELQKNYYEDMVSRNDNWELIEIYADEGISGTSLKHRDAFNKMIEDCKAGKLDMIITKSVSRFARNIVDCITIVQELGKLPNPVGVFFETESIFTLNSQSELSLSFTAAMAQEESHVKSSIMNASIEMRFSHGLVLTPVLLGYDHDENGNLVINEEEAKTVRLIFFMFLYGYTCSEIADLLNQLNRKSKKGNVNWSSSSIYQILRNERHMGEVLARKTFTPDYKDHKSKKNMGDRPQYRWRDHHEAIISRDDFLAVQRILDNARYGAKGVLPELRVIETGALRGFVTINPRWAMFTAEDYYAASRSVYTDPDTENKLKDEYKVETQSGDFDLRGFEIARSQFFTAYKSLSILFSAEEVKFSIECIRKINSQYVELLVHPDKKIVVVREPSENIRTKVQWRKIVGDEYQPKPVRATAFMKALYSIFEWNPDCKYRIQGIKRSKGKETLLVFDMRDAEAFVPPSMVSVDTDDEVLNTEQFNTGRTSRVRAYPAQWGDSFGTDYYVQSQSTPIDQRKKWESSENGKVYAAKPELNPTSPDVVETHIHHLVQSMKTQEEA